MTPQEFRYLQTLSYDEKVKHATIKARAFRDWAVEHEKDICVSIGGLDSITLYYFLKKIGVNAVPASVSVLEDISIQKIHRQIPGMVFIKPYKSKVQVLQELGFPVISKGKAAKISNLQNPDNPKQTFIHAIMTGDMGEQGHFQHSDKIKLPEKWIRLFGGLYNEHRPDLACQVASFKVSADCCKWMKEKPAQDWQKENNMVPYLGLMASEGGQRELGLVKNGCNYYGKTTVRSCPFAIFMRQDLLQLALDLHVPVPEIYGTIERAADRTLYTTKAQRTGCQMCGFGIHIEKRPHRFDRLYERNPKEWDFWMNRCCTDESGEKYGWGRVLDYIGVEWLPESMVDGTIAKYMEEMRVAE
ncbi:hypothetical protein [Faecalispora jeddahensis]|uniref:hypothetical protein n=1 Tax=Faecalispora jeddahensis TaxID=1414721 RepID=UPI001A9BF02B|nr:hypothetical protein [Faecalispora jeddahensis]